MERKYYFALFVLVCVQCKTDTYDTVIRHATVMDGSGSAGLVADVALNADTIVRVGDLRNAKGVEEVDATGFLLAPGFIDAHSHHDWGLNKSPETLAAVSQGITTIVVGQDGSSNTPLSEYFQHRLDSPAAVNIASYSGHNIIRFKVMGMNYKRKATPEEIEQMKEYVRKDMEAGALGLSTGLEYDPGIYSSKEEVLALASVAAEYKGRYISHIRSEDRYFWDAINEIINIGRVTNMPVQISHFKLAMRGLWGKADSTLQLLEAARQEGVNITADIYPYTYWSSTIRVLFPDRNFGDEKEAEFILREVTSPEGIIFSSYGPMPEYNGKSLAEVAALEKRSPAKMLIELIKRLDACDAEKGDCDGSIVATSMDEQDVEKLMQWEHTVICSDGASEGRHPRGFGAFTKVLGYYVKKSHALSWEKAVQKMTSQTADQLGIKKRGKIAPGYFADLVLIDTAAVKDQSTIQSPQQISIGIETAWVNGKKVWLRDKSTGLHPGRIIKRE